MKKTFGFPVWAMGVLLACSGCMRNDDEPDYPRRPIARLYVSIESFQTDESQDAIDNVVLIDPADTTELYIALNFNSRAQGGAGIHFNPFAGRVFQGGYGDTTIRVMTVGALGTLGNSGAFGHRELNAMRGLAYHANSRMLYVANNATPTSIYAFYQPMNRNGFTRPTKVFRLGAAMRPWGLALWNDSLLVSNAGTGGGISLYAGLSQPDSVVADFQPQATVRIDGATAIRGFAFVDSLDLLVVADYGTGTPTEPVADGRVYIIEGIKAQLASGSATVRPTRIISGAQTGLVGPVDVAVDPRGEAGRRTIFVADRDQGRISRFRLSDNGNVAPETAISLGMVGNIVRRPFGIYLDVRGTAQE